MIKDISNETISAIKDGAVVKLADNAEIKIIGKSAVLTIDGKNYDWDEDEVNWVENCVKQINDVITNHNAHKLYEINTILKDVKSEIESINNIRNSYNTLKNVMESINSIFSTDMEQGENVHNLMNKIVIVMALMSSPMWGDRMFAERVDILTMYAWSDMRKAMKFIDKL